LIKPIQTKDEKMNAPNLDAMAAQGNEQGTDPMQEIMSRLDAVEARLDAVEGKEAEEPAPEAGAEPTAMPMKKRPMGGMMQALTRG
jgi:hypothetical protein